MAPPAHLRITATAPIPATVMMATGMFEGCWVAGLPEDGRRLPGVARKLGAALNPVGILLAAGSLEGGSCASGHLEAASMGVRLQAAQAGGGDRG